MHTVQWLSRVTKAARSSLGFTKPGNNYAKWLCTIRYVCFLKKCLKQDTNSHYCCSLWFCPSCAEGSSHQESVCTEDWFSIINVHPNHSILFVFYLATFYIQHYALHILQNRILTGNATIAIFQNQLILLLEHTDLVQLSKKNKENATD